MQDRKTQYIYKLKERRYHALSDKWQRKSQSIVGATRSDPSALKCHVRRADTKSARTKIKVSRAPAHLHSVGI